MLVSVIIPTYNRADFLKRSITSVLNQSFNDLELIIVDDGSTDHTHDVVGSFSDKRIKYLKKENAGVSSARNLGVKNSKGDYIAFLDSDDEWHRDKLASQVSYLKNTGKVLVHTAERWLRDGKVVKQKKHHQKHGGDMFIRSLQGCVISPSSVLMKKELFEQIGGMREDFVVCEDYDFWLKVTSLYDIGFLENEFVNKYGGHEDQLSFKFFAMDYWRVKSMAWILQNRPLSEERSKALLESCHKKCQYLMKGYKKHQNFKDYEEVKSIASFVTLHK
ncbi:MULTISPECIES: glycosyltransferase family 2 protein [Halobacteriovorax]|uniref:glycosyltransferase family 2 protein n=1 Tax=Halobacteriovorax TaxID=1652133 RepID=UPI0018F48D6D|nr:MULTISPECIES: glycosyltransferase [Halobacteriovorax]